MPPGLPKGAKKAKFSEVFSKDPDINRLSAARFFLFGARDVWFVVGVPIYFHAVFSDGTTEGARQAFFLVGGFMACWIVGYGVVQAAAPKLLKAANKALGDIVGLARAWAATLAAIPFALAALAYVAMGEVDQAAWLTPALIVGLLVFGVVFALNSSLHSFLILAFSKRERVTMDVGFYYMSNRGRTAGGNAALRPQLSARRPRGLPCGRGRDGGDELPDGGAHARPLCRRMNRNFGVPFRLL